EKSDSDVEPTTTSVAPQSEPSTPRPIAELARAIDRVLHAFEGVTVTRDKSNFGWILAHSGRDTNVGLAQAQSGAWYVRTLTRLLAGVDVNQLAFQRRLLELNNFEVTGPGRLFVAADASVWLGTMRDARDLDQVELIEHVMAVLGPAAKLASDLEEE